MNDITIECTTDELGRFLEAATSEGSCLILLHDQDGTPVYLRAVAARRKNGRPRKPREGAGSGVPAAAAPAEK